MKKLLALTVALMLLCSLALAEETTVRVSITDQTGAIVLAYREVAVTDADADGTLTIGDALACAHEAYHADGSEAFLAVSSEFGLSMVKLWGAENGSAFGYCVNDASAMSLLDPVADGDHVKAYAYTDLTGWSDTYCFFNVAAVQAAPGAEIALTLSAAGFDENWNPVTLPAAEAIITINGEPSGLTTDTEGKVVLTMAEEGEYLVSAAHSNMNLVAPVCVVTIAK